MLANFQSNFTVSLTLYSRHIPGIFKPYSVIFILVQALGTLAYLGAFRFSHTQVYSKRFTQYLERFKVIQSYIIFRHVIVSRIFRYIHEVTHIEAYLPTLGLRSVQSNVKKYLLFKSGSFFKSLFKSIWNIFRVSKSQHLAFFSSGQYFNNNNNNNNNINPSQHATHAGTYSTPFLKLEKRVPQQLSLSLSNEKNLLLN